MRNFSLPFNPPSYNYFDYQQAWYNTFFFQNDKFQHTWFFIFDRKYEIKYLPAWFGQWWSLFGSDIRIMPPPLVNKFKKYSKDNPLPPQFTHLPYFIYFSVHFQVPWIMGWDYEFSSENSLKFVTRKILSNGGISIILNLF
jgi:hypothetical protein